MARTLPASNGPLTIRNIADVEKVVHALWISLCNDAVTVDDVEAVAVMLADSPRHYAHGKLEAFSAALASALGR